MIDYESSDVRTLRKWLNEDIDAPIDRQALARVLASICEAVTPFAWATHHAPPMIFLTEKEAAAYCDDEEPIPLYEAPVAQVPVEPEDDPLSLSRIHPVDDPDLEAPAQQTVQTVRRLTEADITSSYEYGRTRDKGCFHAGALWGIEQFCEVNGLTLATQQTGKETP